MSVVQTLDWGQTPQGMAHRYILRNARGNQVTLSDWGALVQSWLVGIGNGELRNIVLGYDRLAPYLSNDAHLGVTVGRYANRIANGRFELDGHIYRLATGGQKHQLHGGPDNFSRRLWSATPFTQAASACVRFDLTSPDGDQGFPGQLNISCTYYWQDDDRLRIVYAAETNAPTHCNPTHHAYFNLAGGGSTQDHHLWLAAGTYLPVDEELIPTGDFRPVDATPFDLQISSRLGDKLAELKHGYDHNFVLDGPINQLREVAKLTCPATRLSLRCWTTEPGLQLYTATFPDREAVCLETQHFPDSPNRPDFPSTVLRPGEAFHSETVYGVELS